MLTTDFVPVGGRADRRAWVCRLEIFAFFMFTGAISTLVLKEGKQLTLEELSNERQDGFIDGTFYSGLTFEGALTAYMSQGVHMMRKLGLTDLHGSDAR